MKHSEGKKPSGRRKSRRVDNIKIDHQIVGWRGMNWLRTGTGGGRLEILSKYSAPIKYGEFFD